VRNTIARLAAIAIGLGLMTGIGVATARPAAAVTCPSGSTTWNVEQDANSNWIAQNADNFGTGADTCFNADTYGGMDITQADLTGQTNPTSYPNDGWGCSASYCTSGWASELWSTPTMKVTGTLDTSGVDTGSKFDLLVDSLFSTSTTYGYDIAAEVEVVTYADPGYSQLGFCTATSCGATSETIGSNTWWLSYKSVYGSGCSCTWDDYVFVRGTMTKSLSNLNLATFYSTANTYASGGHGGGLGTLYLSTAEFGSELWKDGYSLFIDPSVAATNVP
jgi:hypothetical protein